MKRAFDSLPRERIGFAEDGLEHFAIALRIMRPVIANDIKGYRYNYGAGATGGKSFSLSSWLRVASSFGLVSRVSHQLAVLSAGEGDLHFADAVSEAADGFASRLGELLFAQWDDRDDLVLAQEVFERASDAFGVVPTAAQVMRLVRDEAYAVWDAGDVLREKTSGSSLGSRGPSAWLTKTRPLRRRMQRTRCIGNIAIPRLVI